MAKGGKASKEKEGKTKRAPSAYMIYSTEVRPKVKSDNPDLAFGDISKKIGQMWNALSDAEKAPYNEKAKAQKDAAPKKEASSSKKKASKKEASEESSEESDE